MRNLCTCQVWLDLFWTAGSAGPVWASKKAIKDVSATPEAKVVRTPLFTAMTLSIGQCRTFHPWHSQDTFCNTAFINLVEADEPPKEFQCSLRYAQPSQPTSMVAHPVTLLFAVRANTLLIPANAPSLSLSTRCRAGSAAAQTAAPSTHAPPLHPRPAVHKQQGMNITSVTRVLNWKMRAAGPSARKDPPW